MINFESIRVTYRTGAGQVAALDDVTLRVGDGEFVVLLGENGSGKSSLVRLANGIALPDEGHVTVDGFDTTDPRHWMEVRERVGMVFQRPDDQIVATSVESDVAFGPENLGLPRDVIRERVDTAIDACGLRGLEQHEPHLLSGGQRQRLAIAGALAMQPRHLVLDEPASMLDAASRREVLDVVSALADRGTGVLLVTHDVSDALRADRIVVLHSGRIVYEGGYEELLAQGPRMADWGLELPALASVATSLAGFGLTLGDSALSAEGMAEALWG